VPERGFPAVFAPGREPAGHYFVPAGTVKRAVRTDLVRLRVVLPWHKSFWFSVLSNETQLLYYYKIINKEYSRRPAKKANSEKIP
jgi:hypothetical protein